MLTLKIYVQKTPPHSHAHRSLSRECRAVCMCLSAGQGTSPIWTLRQRQMVQPKVNCCLASFQACYAKVLIRPKFVAGGLKHCHKRLTDCQEAERLLHFARECI